MNSEVFEECYQYWKNSNGYSKFWGDLAKKFGYKDGEQIRNHFKKERKRRGITKEKSSVQITLSQTGNAKVAVVDLEFSALTCYSFDIWNTNIGIDQIISDSYMLCWSLKILNESEIHFDCLSSQEAIEHNDFRIVKSLWEILNGCQVLIGHNLRDYDLRKLNTRMLVHNLPPLSKHQVVDTLQVAKQNFSFISNSLKYINRYLNIKQKQENEGFGLWIKCMQGNEKALNEMNEYCQYDVYATEDLYYRLRPFVKGHPNLALYFDTREERCPNCGSTNLDKDQGFYFTPAGKWASVRCLDCGAVSRTKQNELDKDKKKNLLVS